MYLTRQPRGVTPYPFESWKGVVPYEYILGIYGFAKGELIC